MKQVYNYWMPDSDNHFERLIAKRISKGGPVAGVELLQIGMVEYHSVDASSGAVKSRDDIYTRKPGYR